MDEGEELRKLKWVLGIGVLFLISLFKSWSELKFLVWGETAEATISRTFETDDSMRRGPELLAVEYSFQEADGTQRSERDDVPLDWPLPAEGAVTVQYLAGVADSSRLEGHSQFFWVWFLLACIAGLAFFVYKMHREVNAPIRGRTSGGRKGGR